MRTIRLRRLCLMAEMYTCLSFLSTLFKKNHELPG